MKKKIALVTGGYSRESEISYKSAVTVKNNLDKEKYEVYLVDIEPSGWVYINEEGSKTAVDRSDFSINAEGVKIKFDAALMCIHGTPGEDGKLQGYFDMLHLPYTSCDAACSALTFNKRYTVAVAAFGGIHVAKSLHLFKDAPLTAENILKELTLPVFVKPNNGGSSIGMSKVVDAAHLDQAIYKAFQEDDQVLVEEFIKGRELTIGVFKKGDEIILLPATEIITHNEFFDFEAKYEGKSEEITPADVDESVLKKLHTAAREVYQLLNCNGIVRIDFIYNEERGEVFMLEVNTVPGQSEASLIPQQVKAMGWSLKEFYTVLIEEALANKN